MGMKFGGGKLKNVCVNITNLRTGFKWIGSNVWPN